MLNGSSGGILTKEKILIRETIQPWTELVPSLFVLLFFVWLGDDFLNPEEPFRICVMAGILISLSYGLIGSWKITLYEAGIGYTFWSGRLRSGIHAKVVHFSEIEHISAMLLVEVKEDRIVFFRGRRLKIYTGDSEFYFPDPSDSKELDVLAFLEKNIQPTRPEVFHHDFDCDFFSAREEEELKAMVEFKGRHTHVLSKFLLGYLTKTGPTQLFFNKNAALQPVLEQWFKHPLEHLKTLPVEYDE